MVRFAWGTNSGALAYAKRKQTSIVEGANCMQLKVDVEVAGKHNVAEACFLLPGSWSESNQVSPLGVFIVPGASQAKPGSDTLMGRLAVTLAKAGHLVVRSPHEASGIPAGNAMHRVFEAAVSAPYAASVRQWVLIGYSVGNLALCRSGLLATDIVAGYCLISYPLQHEMSQLGGPKPGKMALDSRMDSMLVHLRPPVLLVQPDKDEGAPFPAVVELAGGMASCDVRMLHLKGADHALRLDGSPVSRSTVRTVVGGVRQFVAGLVAGSLDGCGIPSIRRTAAPPPVAAPPREAPTAKRAPLKRPTEALAEASDRAAKQAALAAPVQKEARPKAAAAEEAGAMAGLECLGDLDELALSEEEGREGEGGGAEAERLQRLGSQPQVMPTEALQGQMGRREAGWAGRPGYVEPPQLQGSEYAPRPQLQPGSQRMVSPQMFHGQDMFQRQLSPGQHFQVGGLSQSPQSGMGLPPGMAAQMAAQQQQQQQQGLQGLHGAGQQGDGMGWVMGHGGMSAPQQVHYSGGMGRQDGMGGGQMWGPWSGQGGGQMPHGYEGARGLPPQLYMQQQQQQQQQGPGSPAQGNRGMRQMPPGGGGYVDYQYMQRFGGQ
eukprot:jgi/Tetstr1/455219/TSEL_042067.t1